MAALDFFLVSSGTNVVTTTYCAMQAWDDTDNALVSWVATGAEDFAGASYAGPGPLSDVTLLSTWTV